MGPESWPQRLIAASTEVEQGKKLVMSRQCPCEEPVPVVHPPRLQLLGCSSGISAAPLQKGSAF